MGQNEPKRTQGFIWVKGVAARHCLVRTAFGVRLRVPVQVLDAAGVEGTRSAEDAVDLGDKTQQ